MFGIARWAEERRIPISLLPVEELLNILVGGIGPAALNKIENLAMQRAKEKNA